MTQQSNSLILSYTLLSEDVRIEASNQLSLMGVMHQIVTPQLPVSLLKFAVINHWEKGSGEYLTEVRILTPDRRQTIAVSQPSIVSVPDDGYADNVTVFINTTFSKPGTYVVQTLVDSSLFSEKILPVILVNQPHQQQQQMTESTQVN